MQWHFSKGNNHQLLREIIVDKFGFAEAATRDAATVCWLQSAAQKELVFGGSKNLHEEHLPEIGRSRAEHHPVVYNYLEGQSELTNKEKLFRNMRKHYPESIGSYIPSTFVIDFRMDQGAVEESLLEFLAYYFRKDPSRRARTKALSVRNFSVDITISPKVINRLIDKLAAEEG
jgi:hypothetical protein